jgi:hypothetical protein
MLLKPAYLSGLFLFYPLPHIQVLKEPPIWENSGLGMTKLYASMCERKKLSMERRSCEQGH